MYCYRLYIHPTELRKDITYIISTNWIRFIILGFVPFILLVILYANIYWNLQKRKKRSKGKLHNMQIPYMILPLVLMWLIFLIIGQVSMYYILIDKFSKSIRSNPLEEHSMQNSPIIKRGSKFQGVFQRIKLLFDCQQKQEECNVKLCKKDTSSIKLKDLSERGDPVATGRCNNTLRRLYQKS